MSTLVWGAVGACAAAALTLIVTLSGRVSTSIITQAWAGVSMYHVAAFAGLCTLATLAYLWRQVNPCGNCITICN